MNAIYHQSPRTLSLPLMGGDRFFYAVILAIYGHAIFYPIIDRYFPILGGKLLTYAIAAALALSLYGVGLSVFLKGKISGGLTVALLFAFVLNGAFSLIGMFLYFGIVDLEQFTVGFYKTILPVTLAIIGYVSLRTVQQGYRVLQITSFAALVIGLIGVATYLLGDIWTVVLLQLRDLEKLPLHFGGVLRMTSILWNPLVFGIFSALHGILAWNAILLLKRGKLFWYLLLTVSVIGAIASFTRTAWVVLAVGFAVSSFWGVRVVLRKAMRILVLFVLLLLLVLMVPLPRGNYSNMAEAIRGHIEATFVYENPRVENFKVNLERIAQFPIGYGLGTAGYAALPTRGLSSPAVFQDYIAADNNYLSMALQVGIQGLLLFILAQLVALRKIVAAWKRATDHKIKFILGTATGWIVGLMVGAIFLNIWEYNLIPHLEFALIGIALKVSSLQRMKKSPCEVGVALTQI